MKMSFRWYGKEDNIPLKYINQIPGIKGIVTAIYDIPPGKVWPQERIKKIKNNIENSGLRITAIESLPVHEDIKLGLSSRDKYIENYQKSIINLAKEGIKVITYNFMPVFDWMRTDTEYELSDKSKTLRYENSKVKRMDPKVSNIDLPGWDMSYSKDELKEILTSYQNIDEKKLWANLEYFLEPVVETAEKVGVKLAIHPDDPPWSIFDLPRIITNQKSLDKLINLIDSPSNGLALCSGSLGVNSNNDLPKIIRYFGEKNKINFAHVRNIRIEGERTFTETAHLSKLGDLDMYEILKAYYDINYKGPMRPDHGRMIWGEKGKPGYGLFDRALGALYLQGLWESIDKD